MALALGCLLGKLLKGKGLEGLEEDKVHTCGGPRRRPGLGEGRGRRITWFDTCDIQTQWHARSKRICGPGYFHDFVQHTRSCANIGVPAIWCQWVGAVSML